MRDLGLFLALIFIITNGISTLGAEIIYPKSNNVIINSPTTFFVGNENPEKTLFINDKKVDIHPCGGFYIPVDLNIGENIFKFTNGETEFEYNITRKSPTTTNKSEPKQTTYKEPKIYTITGDNTPLRSTPYDFGANRLQHLSKGIDLQIVGEFENFFKVQLARDDYAWIAKSNVKASNNTTFNNGKIQGFVYSELPDVRTFTLKLNKKLPYTLSENIIYKTDNNIDYKTLTNGLDLVVYNVEGYPENKYEFHINMTGQLFGYKTYYKNNNELVIEVKNPPVINKSSVLNGINITIDPGHGGNELGAIGCLGDKEKDINLQIALRLQKKLNDLGANVFMTRTDDSEVSLADRVKFSQKNNSDIFISIHNNAFADSQAKSGKSGTSAYYYYPQSKNLAKIIQKTLVDELGLNDDKVRQESFAVVRNTESLAVLLEIGYMILPDENSKLISEDFQNNAADAIINGLEKYLNDLQ